MSPLFIRTLSARACVCISCVFAAGDSYKDTKSGNEKRRNGLAEVIVPVSKEFSKGGSYLYLGSFTETFAVTKIILIINLIES